MKKFIPYGRQTISNEDIDVVVKTLKSDFLTQGPLITNFEKRLADYTGAKYCVVVNSGTAALHTVYFALGLTQGDEFITSAMTFAATANAGLYLGAKPRFVDIVLSTGNIDISQIENAITKQTKLISVIHYAGLSVDMEQVKKIAHKHNLLVVEDACHALGGEYKNEKIGNCKYSDAAILSFHPVKHITTGEGGAILTNRKEVYERALMFRSHGITKDESQYKYHSEGSWYHEMQLLGFNYRMTDIQASLGISQLKKIDKFVKSRREIATQYNELFKDFDLITTPQEDQQTMHAYHLYPIRLSNVLFKHKQQIFEDLHQSGIGAQTHYIPVYHHPYYREHGFKNLKLENAEEFYKAEISLPMYYSLKNKDIQQVANTLKKLLLKYV